MARAMRASDVWDDDGGGDARDARARATGAACASGNARESQRWRIAKSRVREMRCVRVSDDACVFVRIGWNYAY